MKKVILAVAIMGMAGGVMAQTVTGTQTSTTTSTSGASNQGVNVNYNSAGTNDADRDIARINADAARGVADETVTIKNTPSVQGPNLVTSNDTCMGSTSGSLNIAGLGIGGGTSWTDANCVMLKNSREMWNMGMKAAALSRMCDDDLNRAAFQRTGFTCAPDVAPVQVSARSNGVKTTSVATEDTKYFAYRYGR